MESNVAPSATPRGLDKADFVVLLNKKHLLQTLRDLQKKRDVARVEAFLLARCVTRHDGRQILKTEALKFSILPNNLNSFVRRDSSFVSLIKLVINIRAILEKEHGVPFLAAQMMNIFVDMVSSDFLSGNGSQTHRIHPDGAFSPSTRQYS